MPNFLNWVLSRCLDCNRYLWHHALVLYQLINKFQNNINEKGSGNERHKSSASQLHHRYTRFFVSRINKVYDSEVVLEMYFKLLYMLTSERWCKHILLVKIFFLFSLFCINMIHCIKYIISTFFDCYIFYKTRLVKASWNICLMDKVFWYFFTLG